MTIKPEDFVTSGITTPAAFGVAIVPDDGAELDKLTRALYVGSEGNITVILAGDTAPVTFVAVPAGAMLPIRCKKVFATGTTAAAILGLS